jgi:hypothetical protein
MLNVAQHNGQWRQDENMVRSFSARARMTLSSSPFSCSLYQGIVIIVALTLLKTVHLHSQVFEDGNVVDKESLLDAPTRASPAFKTSITGIVQSSSSTLQNSHNTTPSSPPLLLSVPFYVYEELAWENATMGGLPIEKVVTSGDFTKHSNDYWFMKASLRHPMRTNDPAQAKLFVIPLLMNLYSARVYHHNVPLCWNELCDRELLVHAKNVLNQSQWIHQYPERHLVTTSHYGYHLKGKLKMPAVLRQALYECPSITFEQKIFNRKEQLRFSSYLVGNPCPTSETKLYDFALIATLKPTDERFADRQHICEWIHNTSSSALNISVPICGTGVQCPTLAQSKFGFHVRGDTLGSQRLMDTLLSGTVPIFTRIEQYRVQPPWIDWDKLSYFVNVTTQSTFIESLTNILQDERGYQQRHEAVLRHRPLLDWHTLYPFDTYLYMLQAEVYPETRRNTSPWSALILPTPTKDY